MRDQCVVVLGLGPSGLFLVRQLSKITSNIYAVGRYDDVGIYSKYIKKNKRYHALTSEELEKIFAEIRDREGQNPTLYICSDQYLSILLEHKEKWADLIDCSRVDFDTLEIINDKNTVNRYCQNHGVKVPESLPYTKYKENPFYPAIIKWVEKKIETAVNPIGKVKICRSDEEFDIMNKTIRDKGIRETDLFVQTYIEGNNDWQFSMGGYYQNGEALANVVVNQIKQYPQGISAEVITSETQVSERIKSISRSFARELNYSGFLEMEYKVDSNTNDIYLLDINPRPWGWVSILGAVYPDFYKVLQGEAPQIKRNMAIWKSPMRILMSKRNKQNVEISTHGRGIKKAYDIRDRQDLMPSIMIYFMAIKKMLRRIKR